MIEHSHPDLHLESDLRALLIGVERIPDSVRECAERIDNLGLWRRFSRNTIATSCQDAARKRNRLGHTGIPLWDELKSFLGEYTDASGAPRVFLAHCRGDRELDLDRLRHALESAGELRRLDASESGSHGMIYGTVNPFVDDVVQIFDHELRRPLGVPGTVMTNAGDLTWAVEIDPVELVVKLSSARWDDIVRPRVQLTDIAWGVREPEQIGILTGNPCDSGLELCAAINSHIRKLLGPISLGDVSMPVVHLISRPEIGISMEMDQREAPLRQAILKGIDELCAAGARILAHPAHTTHFFAPEMAARAASKDARFVSMADATAAWLRRNGIREVALLGTRYVTDFEQKWSVYRSALDGIIVHRPSEEGWDKIRRLGYAVQQSAPSPQWFNWMRDLLRDEVPDQCAHVVLAMTEFGPVLKGMKKRGRRGKVLIDPVEIYAEAIARDYLGIR